MKKKYKERAHAYGDAKRIAMLRLKNSFIKDIISGCWIWISGLLNGRATFYCGMVNGRGKTIEAAKVLWMLKYGQIPPGKILCHKCDNPLCVNPDHCYVGTSKSNNLEAYRKLRQPKKREYLTLAKIESLFKDTRLNIGERII